MFTDEHRRSIWEQIRQRDVRHFGNLLSGQLIRDAADQSGLVMGRGMLNPATLCWLAICCALNHQHSFGSILTATLHLLEDMGVRPTKRPKISGRRKPGRRCKHDPRGRAGHRGVREEAFVQARNKLPIRFFHVLIRLLATAFLKRHDTACRFHGLRLLALDGTCVDLPRWKRLRDYFGFARNNLGDQKTQGRLVMLQLALARMPLRYALSPLKLGERLVGGWLLKGLAPMDLVLMDMGFFSFGLFWRIQRKQAYFATRLMGGMKFQTLKWLGKKDRLVEWFPSNRKWKNKFLPASMMLRVIEYQIPGFRPTAIVTNLLDGQWVSREQWIGLALSEPGHRRLDVGLYHRRWEIETSFKELKVQQGMEGNLRGRTPQAIQYEVAGHMLLYLLTRWLMAEAAADRGLDPLELSFTEAARELDGMRGPLMSARTPAAVRQLLERLLARIAEHRVPWRPGRAYPRPKDGKIRNKGRGKKRLPTRIEVEQT
jgi:hypothetical protein